MPLFITSKSAATRHGAYVIQRTPPRSIIASGTGVCALVAQFPWGPIDQIVTPTGKKEMLQMIAPDGFSRLGSGYLALLGKAFPELRLVRVVGSAAAAATCNLANATPATCVTLTAKYVGATPNSAGAAPFVVVVSDASDANANHFDLTVTCTSTFGSTQEVYKNINFSGTGTDSVVDLSNSLLLASVTKVLAGRPVNVTNGAFSGGSDGTVTSADYEDGIELLEDDLYIRHVFTDDVSNDLRTAVNTALIAHSDAMKDRLVYINGNSGLDAAGVRAAKLASNASSEYVVFSDPWVYINDDVTGAERLVPPSPFVASVAAQVSPSTSIAWKDSEIGSMLSGIVRLEKERGAAIPLNTRDGIVTLIKEVTGGFRIEAGVLTIANADAVKRNISRTRMGIYIADAFTRAMRPSIDSPNVGSVQMAQVAAVDSFLTDLKRNASQDPAHTPYIVDYQIGDLSAVNSANDIANGDFTIPVSVKLGSSQERIFLSIQFGENVVIVR